MDECLSPFNKGLGWMEEAHSDDEVANKGWNLLREDLSLPVAVLYEERLAHNLVWMRRFIDAYEVALCPHGKTTMAPKLFRRQLDEGAWGITLATASQVRVAHAHGVRRVIMANQLVGKANMEIVSRLLADPGFEFYCLVDSTENVEALGRHFAAEGRCVDVLIEVGVTGGRAGIRGAGQLAAVLSALLKWRDSVRLCGVELFEGVLRDETGVRKFLAEAIQITQLIVEGDRFGRTPFLLSGAGSAWFDVVAEMFSAAEFGQPVEIVLRPGCYLTHDVGLYVATQERLQSGNPVAQAMGAGLIPALHVWAYIQSRPESGLAIVGIGKRDASFDVALPQPALHYRPGTKKPTKAAPCWRLTKMMDQHGMLEVEENDDLRIGDMIAFDIAHPCLTFDKWRSLPILDSDFGVVDIVRTYF